MSTLDGKVALVSGAARGIGAAIAEALAHNGAKVVIGDLLDEDGLARAEQFAPSATYVHLDVTNADDWDAAVATAVERYGKLDVLVNNAGIAQAAPIDQYPRADWDKIVAVNLRGRIFGAFELAELEEDAERRAGLLTFVVVGAGPTGVEMAGQIAELSRHSLRSNFRRIDTAAARIVLLDAAPRILASLDERLARRAAAKLERMGVEIRTGTLVTGMDAAGVELKTGDGVAPSGRRLFCGGPVAAIWQPRRRSSSG